MESIMSYPRIFHSSSEACTGCKVCEMICSLIAEKKGINPKRSRIRISENPDEGIYIPVVCNLCENTPCIDACPESALSKDKKLSTIRLDKDICSGCGLCVEACDYNAIFLDPVDNIACVCDLCGGEPKCVKYCLQEALVFLKPEEYELKKDKKIMIKEI